MYGKMPLKIPKDDFNHKSYSACQTKTKATTAAMAGEGPAKRNETRPIGLRVPARGHRDRGLRGILISAALRNRGWHTPISASSSARLERAGCLSFEEASKKFYSQSQAYVFDVLSSNPNRRVVVEKLNRFSPAIVSSIRQHCGKRFLEFGGGVGLFCEIVVGFGKDVTYLDIPGRVSEFAAWRFRKYGLPVRTVIIEPGRLDVLENYDIIYSDAVLEHIPRHEQQRVVKVLGDHVSAGGMLVLLVDLSGPTPENPTHEVVDINRLHSTLEGCGLRCQDGRGNFWSIWRRP